MQWHACRSFPGCVRSNLPFGGIEAGDADRLRAVLCHDLVPASRHGLDVETCVDEADGPSNESALHLAAHRVDALAGHRTALVTQKGDRWRSEEHTSELQSLMRISYAVFCLKKKNNNRTDHRMTSSVIYSQYTHS